MAKLGRLARRQVPGAISRQQWDGKRTVQQSERGVHMKQVRTLLGAFEA
ncbi:MAG: hypothetical protein IMZ44_05375 [Planctomycetes bacterium]|nr:hypothetical protein [Planctomycetota bacterium]